MLARRPSAPIAQASGPHISPQCGLADRPATSAAIAPVRPQSSIAARVVFNARAGHALRRGPRRCRPRAPPPVCPLWQRGAVHARRRVLLRRLCSGRPAAVGRGAGALLRAHPGPRPPATRPGPTATPGSRRCWSAPRPPGARLCALQLDVQGIPCAACVWLMNETFRRQGGAAHRQPRAGQGAPGGARLRRGRLRRQVEPSATSSARRARAARRAICSPAPGRHRGAHPQRDAVLGGLLLRALARPAALPPLHLAVAGALHRRWWWSAAGPSSPPLGGRCARACCTSTCRSPWASCSSTPPRWCRARGGRGDLAYFDTLNTFITLMLLGRFLQERVLERNRRYLLEDDGADGLWCAGCEGAAPAPVRAPPGAPGDVLLVARATWCRWTRAARARASVSTDWITGESDAPALGGRPAAQAGSFNAGARRLPRRGAARLRRLAAGVAPARPPRAGRRDAPAPARVGPAGPGLGGGRARASALGFALWLPTACRAALNVAVALLVVTCPCAIGIAIPLAYELTQSRLRRAGFFVRSPDLLDRLPRVKKVLFDKTGTLTLGRLELEPPRRCSPRSTPTARDVAFNLAVRSSAPGLAGAWPPRSLEAGARYDASAEVTEVAGQGLEWPRRLRRLGRRERGRWAPPPGSPGRTVLAQDGAARWRVLVAARGAAPRRARRSSRRCSGAGYRCGSSPATRPARVRAAGERLGIPAERALGGLRPEEKAAQVAALDRQRHALPRRRRQRRAGLRARARRRARRPSIGR